MTQTNTDTTAYNRRLNHLVQPIMLLILDTSAVFLSFFLAYWLRNGLVYKWTMLRYEWTRNHLIFLVSFSAITFFLFRYKDLYKEYIYVTGIRQSMLLIKAISLQGLLIVFSAFYGRIQLLLESRILMTAYIVFLFILIHLFRLVVFRILRSWWFSGGRWIRNVLVIGSHEEAREVASFIFSIFANEKKCVGYLDKGAPVKADDGETIPFLGEPCDLEEKLRKWQVNEVFLTGTSFTPSQSIELIEICKRNLIEVNISAAAFGVVSEKVEATFYAAGQRFIPFVTSSTVTMERFMKRAVDLASSLLILLFSWPLFLCIAVLIKRDSRGPVIFRQQRAGINGRPFTVYKFRTMSVDTSEEDHRQAARAFAENDTEFFEEHGLVEEGNQLTKLAVNEDITRVGRWLRKSSLDELPQVFNVLKGEMSLVGPRPLPLYELENFHSWHHNRLCVKPGVTGLWQVTGRSQVSFEDMVLLDIYYALNWSITLDWAILLRTVPTVLWARGAN